MKIVLDVKSILIGLLLASVAFLAMSNKSQQESKSGKFTTEIRDNMVIILNTENGDYIIGKSLNDIIRDRWIKGEFYQTFKTAKVSE
ncbi:hypothetical protein ACFSQ3_00505 [Sphingobacterium corticis]|uniref:Uncharacterized protein n=1 Tax=Sphingobacterium corticis TaxID=1812823 RepID=A0ABW5NE81_9SPHI